MWSATSLIWEKSRIFFHQFVSESGWPWFPLFFER